MLFSADKESHYFERYKPGLYVKLIKPTATSTSGCDCIFVSPEVRFGDLPPDITNNVMRSGLQPTEFFVLRCVNKSLAKNIVFYIDSLKDTDFKTFPLCLDMLKREVFFVGSLHVEADFCEWGKHILETLIESKAPTINVYGPLLGKKGDIAWLAEKLPHNDYVQNMSISVDEMSESDERALGKIVKKCTNLKNFLAHHVYPGKNPKSQLSDRGAQAIAKQMARHKNVRWIEISDSKVGDIGAYAFAAALKNNESLRILSLESNRIGREGMEALIAAGEKHKNLRNLDMEFNMPPDSMATVHAYRTFKLKDGEQGKNWVSWQYLLD
jgi:Leucine Rich Repeat (LRR) protein